MFKITIINSLKSNKKTINHTIMMQSIMLKIKIDKRHIKKRKSMKIKITRGKNHIKKKELWLIQKIPETGMKT
jgi:hypothetical protein